MVRVKRINLLESKSREEWRDWLRRHHDSVSEVWLVFTKRHLGAPAISYEESVEEALCFGWIDSIVRRLDDACYARKFTPRKPESNWSELNRRRYADLRRRGLLEVPGLRRPPTTRRATAPRPSFSDIPPYIMEALQAHPRALQSFEELAPSYRRSYIGWIDSAKKAETKQRRLSEAITLLSACKKLGLK
jgi:uncharacterized protein YdeI (YjbR/CyaY-like superfamily)